ncbi:MAG: glycoside hydrolase family 6 protein, partial [Pseudomonadales bacterium]|nr:glycoside hydrolase family 6 protein [Pseudomonadales bacterium]
MMFTKTTLALGMTSALVLTSCYFPDTDAETTTTTTTITTTATTTENTAPTALPVISGNIIFANATDVDSDTLVYSWAVGSTYLGSTAVINIDSAPASINGVNSVTLTISDSQADPIIIIIDNVDFGGISNSAPTADPIQFGRSLIANANDVDGDPLTYTWSVNSVVIGVGPSFDMDTAPVSMTGLQHVTLEIYDTNTMSTFIVPSVDFGTAVYGVAPVVNAGPNVNATKAVTFILSGSATDADTATSDLTYSWNINGQYYSEATIIVVLENVGSYTALFTVSDGEHTSTDSVIVTVSDVVPINTAPIVVSIEFLGPTLKVIATDAETPSVLTYAWLVEGVSVLGDTSTINALAYRGIQSVSVTVTDSYGLSATKTSIIDFGGSIVEPLDRAVEIIVNYDGDIELDQKAMGDLSANLQTTANPFDDSYFYLNPDMFYFTDYSIDRVTDETLIQKMKYIQQQPTAIWMDSIATITQDGGDGTRATLIGHLDNALKQQSYYAQLDGAISPMSVVVVIYNLPDRNCAA